MRRLPYLLVLASDLAIAQPIEIEVPPENPFDRGKVNLSAAAGAGETLGERYYVIGGGFGYFVLDGLELGVRALEQFGDGPSITKVAPSIRYIAHPLVGKWALIPYVGGFYNHWFVGGGLGDVDTVGGRTGLLYVTGRVLLGLGIAVEKTVSTCEEDCVTAYPDLTISLSF